MRPAALWFSFLSLVATGPALAQLYELETENLKLIYQGKAHEYLVKHVARSYENSLEFHSRLFDYKPTEAVTVFLHDESDYGNAGAGVAPDNHITVAIAPFSYSFETAPANERMNATMNHELVHIVASDKSRRSDNFFRTIFSGKVSASDEDPVSLVYSYLTAPRRYAPRWYHEGIAVFMETWMAGGLGRSLGGYDEMVFRAMVLEDRPFFDPVSLEAEGSSTDFHVGVNSYLYGTRFVGYLAYMHGPETVIRWFDRTADSKAHFAAEFERVFQTTLSDEWSRWVISERAFQMENLERIRQQPVSAHRPLSSRALGSVSRGFFDTEEGVFYTAVNYPGKVAHIAAVDSRTGAARRLTDVKGASLFSVCSFAFDPTTQQIFYTVDNNQWRDLRVLSLDSGQSRALIPDSRIGDLAFNSADKSLWGVRHFLGISTLVRIPPPYEKWHQIMSFDYGTDLYDIDISPDGSTLVGAYVEPDGGQSLVSTQPGSKTGPLEFVTLFDFDISNPESFVFSKDGQHVFGSSYYTGVSNIFRYSFADSTMEVVTNAETGYFRPIPISDDSLVVFAYTGDGFLPARISSRPSGRTGAIRFFGQEIITKQDVLREWLAGSPGQVDIDALTTNAGPYRPLAEMRIASAYPITRGYKDFATFGLAVNVADLIGMHSLTLAASYSPTTSIGRKERWHGDVEYKHGAWAIDGTFNGDNFYDLFGPTKSSRKGYSLGATYSHKLINDRPRQLGYRLSIRGWDGLERLPDYQNVNSSFRRVLTASASLDFEHVYSSLGAVDHEKGVEWSLRSSANAVNGTLYPRVHAEYARGTPLPLSHSSIWLRGSAGKSIGSRSEPFANYYFGGFGNNWVDRGSIKRYRDFYSFPGLDLNAVGGTSFAKAMAEWNLPPILFSHVGGTRFFLKWARVSAFAGVLFTNVEDPDFRMSAVGAGSQIDFRFTLMSTQRMTFSLGYGGASVEGGKLTDELMVSIKVL